jgi:hypothetical protein
MDWPGTAEQGNAISQRTSAGCINMAGAPEDAAKAAYGFGDTLKSKMTMSNSISPSRGIRRITQSRFDVYKWQRRAQE